jgi:hypothetical protein
LIEAVPETRTPIFQVFVASCASAAKQREKSTVLIARHHLAADHSLLTADFWTLIAII